MRQSNVLFMWKTILRKNLVLPLKNLHVSCTTQKYCYLQSGRLQKVEGERKSQIHNSKSGRGHPQEVAAYKKFLV